jgi:hypothetical protein
VDPQVPEVTSLTEARALSLLAQTEEEKSVESIRETTSPAAIVPAICALPPLTSCESYDKQAQERGICGKKWSHLFHNESGTCFRNIFDVKHDAYGGRLLSY